MRTRAGELVGVKAVVTTNPDVGTALPPDEGDLVGGGVGVPPPHDRH
ncbi:hypothetical protein MA5S0921_2152 [Mycobacteroides abscessus 5S-0921]|nr:hypothetical protein MA5S0304_1422 [Mycobacteroides abscessus 5S-0304]EIU93021.1 hypothetical protein MA5S0921_2152 [Mycobacteroides abscessus 5S-0921]